MDYDVPFYSNTSDGVHCWQAALKMVLGYFLPEREFSWEELDSLTGQIPGMWTWPLEGMLWLSQNAFEVKNIEIFDYKIFSQKGKEYLIYLFGEEVANEQDKHSDTKGAQKKSKEFLEKVDFEKRVPSTGEIRKYLIDGYLVICNINAHFLNKKDVYEGHFVVVKGFEGDNFILNDPGPKPLENRKVSYREFEKAWASPNENAKNIMAFRLKK